MIDQPVPFDKSVLTDILTVKMPFGKYSNWPLYKLPVSYLEWFKRKDGFPKGRLGMLLETLYVIRLNGLDFLLQQLLNEHPGNKPRK